MNDLIQTYRYWFTRSKSINLRVFFFKAQVNNFYSYLFWFNG